ncbi:MAG TPA: amino acid ABC transporter substrate-binding protein [Acetobacteraceae bacterium]|nr:amino acid ABC transporter substrate-binding protein [Acetobacteraceae bacterium]
MRFIPLALAAMLLGAPAMAAELTGTLQKVKETGSIAMGVRDSSVPFSYLDEQQKPVGYAIDICYKIIDAVKKELNLPNLKVQLVPVLSSNRIPLMANGTIDLECGSTTNNVDREKQVSFTNTHYLTASKFVAKKSEHLNTIAELAGKTVVSTAGTTNIVQLNQVNAARKLGINVVPAKDHAEAFLMVETGRASAFVMDDIILASLIASAKDPSAYVISDDAFSAAEPYGIMVRKDDVPFKALADKATREFYLSPEGKATYAKWFQSPIPPKGLNLNTPMSAGMKHAFEHPSDNPDPASYN